MVISWKDVRLPDLQIGKVANQLPEDAGVVSAEVEDNEVLKF